MRRIRILGTPMDLGQSRRGVDMGPSALRYAGLRDRLQVLGYDVLDNGNVSTAQAEELAATPPTNTSPTENAHHLQEVSRVCQKIYDRIQSYRQQDDDDTQYVFLGGDHSISMGTVAAMAHDRLGVIWFDAHADINTPAMSLSGNIHGMSVAALLGEGPDALTCIGGAAPRLLPSQIVMVGTRDLDTAERQRLAKGDIRVYTMREVDEMGIGRIAHEILAYFADMTHLHLSLDLDGLDPQVAPGVGTPVPGGIGYREAHLFMEIIADSKKVRSLDIVEVNPILDRQNETARLAVELTTGLFGKRIL